MTIYNIILYNLAGMNYAVHALMYFYYGLMAARRLPKWFPTGFVTASQISQMVVGVVMTIYNIILYNRRDCHVKFSNLVACVLMYFSYFCLFMNFAVERYILKPRRRKSDADAKKIK